MKIYPFKAWLPDKNVIASPTSFTQDVKYHFRNYMESGFFHRREKEEFFVYQIAYGDDRYTGLLGTFDHKELLEGTILPHEKTLPYKEQTSMQLMLDREAIIKPVLLTHPAVDGLHALLKQATEGKDPVQSYDYEHSNEKHTIWAVAQEEYTDALTTLFHDKIKTTYIADGHHRVSVLNRLAQDKRRRNTTVNYDRIIATFFDFNNLSILDYNRRIHYSDFISPLELMARLSQVAKIKPLSMAEKPKKKHKITFYIEGQWFSMEWKRKTLAGYHTNVLLDATILESELMNKILGIKNVESDHRIKYETGDIPMADIISKIDRKSGSAIFFLYPVEMDEVKRQADKGLTLPPKSTFFKPRLPNGFISQSLADGFQSS